MENQPGVTFLCGWVLGTDRAGNGSSPKVRGSDGMKKTPIPVVFQKNPVSHVETRKKEPRRVCLSSRGTFHFHCFQGSFFSGNHEKPRGNSRFLKERWLKRMWNQPLDLCISWYELLGFRGIALADLFPSFTLGVFCEGRGLVPSASLSSASHLWTKMRRAMDAPG